MRDKGRASDDVRDYMDALTTGRVSAREAEVARLVSWSYTNKEIAEELRMSLNTAKVHLTRLLLKLACEDRSVLSGEVRRLVREFRDKREHERRSTTAKLKLVKRKGPPQHTAREPDRQAPRL